MSFITIRLPESQIKRLKQLAAHRRVSMSALFEEVSANMLKEYEASAQAGESGERAEPGSHLARPAEIQEAG